MKLSNLTLIVLGILLLSVVVGCRSLTISMTESNPPVFHFSASRFAECCRHLAFLGVYEVQDGKDNIVLWRIRPADGTDNSAEGPPPINYGKVPVGFIQEIPAKGEPPALVEGKLYEVGGPPVEVSHAYMRFTIRNGKAVQIPKA